MEKELSVILPLPNIDYSLPNFIRNLIQDLNLIHKDWEIIIATPKINPTIMGYIANKFSNSHQIKCIEYSNILTYPAIFTLAFSKSVGNKICYLSQPIENPGLNLRNLAAFLDQENADLAVASKFYSKYVPNASVYKLLGLIPTIVNRLLFNFPFWEIEIKAAIFKREVLEEVLPKATNQPQIFNFELLLRGYYSGRKLSIAPLISNKPLSLRVNLKQLFQIVKELQGVFLNLSLPQSVKKRYASEKILPINPI